MDDQEVLKYQWGFKSAMTGPAVVENKGLVLERNCTDFAFANAIRSINMTPYRLRYSELNLIYKKRLKYIDNIQEDSVRKFAFICN